MAAIGARAKCRVTAGDAEIERVLFGHRMADVRYDCR
jgi:hypothetical protein